MEILLNFFLSYLHIPSLACESNHSHPFSLTLYLSHRQPPSGHLKTGKEEREDQELREKLGAVVGKEEEIKKKEAKMSFAIQR